MRFLSAAVAFVLALLVPALPAQLPGGLSRGGTGEGRLAVSGDFVFVLQDGVLYKFDAESLGLLGKVRLADLHAPRRLEAIEEVAEEVADDLGRRDVAPPAKAAVDAALQWLKAHQDDSGKWDADEFMKHDAEGAPCDGPGRGTNDVGVTGLAVLALLGDGSTLRAGPHRDALKQAVVWLRDQQGENGLVGTNASHDFVYGHAIATLALSEAYGLSNYTLIKPIAQKAIDYLESHRNPYSVWRYQPRDNDNDTSVTTWAWLACKSADFFGLEVNSNVAKLVEVWYGQTTDDAGRTGYTKRGELSSRQPGDHSKRFPPEQGEALTAAAMVGRLLLGQEPKTHPVLAKSAALLLGKPPRWDDGAIDPYYWWFGTQAMYQLGGRYWQQWSRGLDALVKAQRRDGNFAGSWDPVGVWDMDGGRVYATAMHALTLEIPSRAARLK